jgi:hypothetical protein
MDFRLVFATNRRFSVKPKANPFGFKPKLDMFQNPYKFLQSSETSNRDRIWVSRGKHAKNTHFTL